MKLQNETDWKEAPIKAVIFDMDGVLIDSEPIYFEIERSSFNHFGADVTEEEHHTFVGVTLESMWQQVLGKKPLDCTLEDALSYHKGNVMTTMSGYERLEPIPDVGKWLSWLKTQNIPLAVASSSPKALIELIMDKTGLGIYFDAFVTGEEVAHGKPAPDIFLHAAGLLGVEPASCLVIEDSRNGVRAAKSAGIRCVGYHNPGSGNQDLSLADEVVRSYEQLLSIRDSLRIGTRSEFALELES